jgi:multidrug efflux pump subunit AcrB
MTSLCTILGVLPLALGLGPGAQMQQPLAIAVIGGLIANMLVTRLLIPVGWMAGVRITQVFNVLFRPEKAARAA